MKLIQSRVEQQMQEELISSNNNLENGNFKTLAHALTAANANPNNAYVLEWIPEQAEDIYVVIVSLDEILIIEVMRGEDAFLIQREKLHIYEGKCSKIQKLKIAVAKSLIYTKH